MENRNNLLRVVIAVLLVATIFLSFVEADPIIIDPNNNNPFNYSSNNTNQNNTLTNQTTDYFANVTDQTLRKLIEALVSSSQLNDEVKGYLESMIKAYSTNQKDFNDALNKINYAYETMKTDRDKAVSDYNKLKRDTDTDLETINTEIEGIRLENTKLKAWTFFYIIFGLVIGVLVLQIAVYLKKNQKFYFIIRAIRDKIPIKF